MQNFNPLSEPIYISQLYYSYIEYGDIYTVKIVIVLFVTGLLSLVSIFSSAHVSCNGRCRILET